MQLTRESSATTSRTTLQGRPLFAARAALALVAALTLTLFIIALPVRYNQIIFTNGVVYAQAARQLGLTRDTIIWYVLILDVSVIVGTYLAAGLIVWRKPSDWLTIYVAIALLSSVAFISYPVSVLAAEQPLMRPFVGFQRFVGITFVILFYIFPDGRFVPAWSRWLAVAAAFWSAIWTAFLTSWVLRTPSLTDNIGILILGLLSLSGIVAQIYRYRNVSTATQRQQTKWVLFGFGLGAVFYLGTAAPFFIFPSLREPGATVSLAYLLSALPLIYLGQLMVPAALTVSILRYRLWDIDFLISRSLMYGLLTGGLALLYFGIVLILQQVFAQFTGGQQSSIAIAVSTLLIAALFFPIRGRLQKFIDSRYAAQAAPVPEIFAAQPTQTGPRRLGQYELLDTIGYGGMAEVHRARQIALDRIVAIKILPARLAARPDFRKRFEREARTLAALKHPNIVQVFDFGENDGTYYMVMEYIAGRDLDDYLHGSGLLPLEGTLPLLREIADALDYAHAQGLVHRDVKPSNILLDASENTPVRAVLTDFGLTKILAASTAMTQAGIMGTLDYIAPEQIDAPTQVDGRADLYSLGVIAYRMLTGFLPFKAETPGAMIIAHLEYIPADPRRYAPSLSTQTANAILRALAKDPRERFATAGQFVDALTA